MSLFFDTNVCIGYIFKWDPWHEKAVGLFNEDIGSYFSQSVLEEIFKVFNTLVNGYIRFLEKLNYEIFNSEKKTIL
ncbi:MAG: hypothetical protein LBM96_00400 [Methanobrevibacter sp.]|jgi:predicted nucleic acid-binding protein|nr:hypothetical protein [Candidatus Methanoflexus mossambicus]